MAQLHRRQTAARFRPKGSRRVEQKAGAAGNPRSAVLIIALLIVAAAVIPYVQTLQHQFINYDDGAYVYENDTVRRGITWEGFRWAFTTFYAGNWHPLTWLSHMLDVQIWGMWPGGHHLTNVILHALNSLLVFWIFSRMTPGIWRAALVAVIFAAHPLHVQSVAWVAERKDLLSTLFGLLAIAAYVAYARNRSVMRYAGVVCLFALSLMSKPMLVTLPLVLLLLDFWPLKRFRSSGAIGLIAEKIPLLVLSAASSGVTIVAQKAAAAVAPLEALGLQQRIANAIVSYAEYLGKAVWPTDLAAIYPLRWNQPLWLVVLAAALLVGISAIAIALRRSRPYLITGWLWYLGMLVPVIGLIQVGEQAMADRYMYLPMIGLSTMLAWSLPEPRPERRTMAATAGVAFVITLVVVSAMQARYWKDTLTLFNHTIAVTDRNYVAYNLIAGDLGRQGRLKEAIEQVNKSLQARPEYEGAIYNLAVAQIALGDFATAEKHLASLAEKRPKDPLVWNNLGVARLNLGQVDQAITCTQRALELEPHSAEAMATLADAFMKKSNWPEAAKWSAAALELKPDLPNAHACLGLALTNQGELDRAVHHYRAALALNPALVDARFNLAMTLLLQRKLDEAITEIEEVVRVNPQYPNAAQVLEAARRKRTNSVGPP